MMGTLSFRPPERYMVRDKCRSLSDKERSRVFNMYIDDKHSVDYITRYLNSNKAIIEEHLFSTGKNKKFGKTKVVGIIGFEKQTAYWRYESEILESLDPKYDPNELKDLFIFPLVRFMVALKLFQCQKIILHYHNQRMQQANLQVKEQFLHYTKNMDYQQSL